MGPRRRVYGRYEKLTTSSVKSENELTGTLYSILYQDRYLRCYTMNRHEIRWICDNRYLFKTYYSDEFGEVIEYRNFKKKLNEPLKHNFLVRNKIINANYI